MPTRMDAAVPADARNASTATWKTAQNAVSHSAHTPHRLVRREEDRSRFTHRIPDTPKECFFRRWLCTTHAAPAPNWRRIDTRAGFPTHNQCQPYVESVRAWAQRKAVCALFISRDLFCSSSIITRCSILSHDSTSATHSKPTLNRRVDYELLIPDTSRNRLA
jgi:hypothetical protein